MRKAFFIFFISILTLSTLQAQSTLEKFGRNRVQYKRFNWRSLKTANFDIYYYDNGKRLADFATRFLETEFDEITNMLGYTPYFKTKIFVYNAISDLQQSNVGIDDTDIITGGQTDFFKSIVEIPFTGNEVDFKKELRYGISLMLIREMMFGGNLKEMLQSSYLGNFSEWFLIGAAAYVAEGWNEEMDDRMRDVFSYRRVKKPNLLSEEEAVFAGQSIWNFIAEKYGVSNIASVLNLARITRNERLSLNNTLGVNYNRFIEDWKKYYRGMTLETKENTLEANFKANRLRRKNRRDFVFNQMRLSPSGDKVAYSQNRNGKYCVIIQNLRTKKKKVILRSGYHAINQRYDKQIPALAWKNNEQLGVMFVRKGETDLRIYNRKKKVIYKRTWFYFNHVDSFDFSDDGNFIVLSADRKGRSNFKTGQNDIFLFNIEEINIKQITDDWYDDLNPEFLPNSTSAFVFSSNRLEDTLSTTLIKDRGNFSETVSNFDIFMYNPTISTTSLSRLTNAAGRDLQPRFLDKQTLVYLNDDSGILQLKKYNIATGKTQKLTNYKQSIRSFDVHGETQGLAYMMIRKTKYYPRYQSNFDFGQDLQTNFKTFRARLLENRNPQVRVAPKKEPKPIVLDSSLIQKEDKEEVYLEDEVDTDNYTFEGDLVKEEQNAIAKVQSKMLERARRAKQNQVKVRGPYDYEERFRTENITTTIEIDPIRNFGFVINMNTSDLLENHKLRGGFFMTTDLQNSDFYGEYRYLARRLDYGFRYDRQKYFFQTDAFAQEHVLNQFQPSVSYPINNLLRFTVTPFYATSRHTISGNLPSTGLNADKDSHYHYTGAKLEVVFDNTVVNGLNMIQGTRLKARFEVYQGVGLSSHIRDIGVENNDLSFNKLSLDFRNYFKLHKDLILATRLYYGRFAGQNPQTFVLGGMDNWIGNSRDDATINGVNPLNTNLLFFAPNPNGGLEFFGNESIIFTEVVTNMRGFDYNKLAGENVFLANIELRFPIIKYLFGKRVNSNFFKNLQLVGFYDVGSAWTGISPFNRENSINTRFIGDELSVFTATIQDFKNPWLVGYGFGVRTTLLGYYLKFDAAWAVEDFIVADEPRFYLTFGYDF